MAGEQAKVPGVTGAGGPPFRRAVLAFLSSLAARAAGGFLFWLLARRAGPEPAGVFALGIACTSIAGALAWGVDDFSLRTLAGNPEGARRYLPRLLGLRVALGLFSLCVLSIAVRWAGYPAEITTFLTLFAFALVPDAVTTVAQALFQARHHPEALVVVGAAGSLLKLGGGALVLFGLPGISWAETGLYGVALLWVAGSVAGAMLCLAAAWRAGRALPPQPGAPAGVEWRRILSITAPIALVALITLLEWQADTVLLSLLKGMRVVGWYSAAASVFAVLWVIPQAYRVAVSAETVQAPAMPPGQLQRLYTGSMRVMLLLALPAAVSLWLLAPDIVALLYGAGFEPSVPALRWLGLALVPLFLGVSGGRLLVVKGRQAWLVWFVTAGLAVNVIANLWLIPGWGAEGTAIARLLAATVFYVLQRWSVRRYVPLFSFWRTAWRPALAAGGMALAVAALRAHTFWGALAGGGLL